MGSLVVDILNQVQDDVEVVDWVCSIERVPSPDPSCLGNSDMFAAPHYVQLRSSLQCHPEVLEGQQGDPRLSFTRGRYPESSSG